MSRELPHPESRSANRNSCATFANGIMGIAITITFCFCITNLQDIVGPDATSFPIIQVIYNATGSYAATCVLGSLLVVLLFFSTVTTIASASRQVWAFSRDRVRYLHT